MEISKANQAVLASMQAQLATSQHSVMAMAQTLLATSPTSPRRRARIDAALALLQSVLAMENLFALVMSPDQSGSNVEDGLEIVDMALNKSDERLLAYVEAQRGDETDQAFSEPQSMLEFVQARAEAEKRNAGLDSLVEGYREAQKTAEEIDGEVGEILPGANLIRVKRRNIFKLPSLTDAPKVVS